MHSGDKAPPIVYFTLIVGEHCSHMMINRTLEHVHHNALIMSSLLIVNALNPNVALGYKTFFRFSQDFQPISWIRLNNKVKTFSLNVRTGIYLSLIAS